MAKAKPYENRDAPSPDERDPLLPFRSFGFKATIETLRPNGLRDGRRSITLYADNLDLLEDEIAVWTTGPDTPAYHVDVHQFIIDEAGDRIARFLRKRTEIAEVAAPVKVRGPDKKPRKCTKRGPRSKAKAVEVKEGDLLPESLTRFLPQK